MEVVPRSTGRHRWGDAKKAGDISRLVSVAEVSSALLREFRRHVVGLQSIEMLLDANECAFLNETLRDIDLCHANARHLAFVIAQRWGLTGDDIDEAS